MANSTSANEDERQRAEDLLALARVLKAEKNGTVVHSQAAAQWLDWGHGHQGEVCCMCSRQYGGATGTVVIYAVEDYDNDDFFDRHSAFWHCEHECEQKCGWGGHKFGCLDEDHLRQLSRAVYGMSGFTIEHQRRFGNLC